MFCKFTLFEFYYKCWFFFLINFFLLEVTFCSLCCFYNCFFWSIGLYFISWPLMSLQLCSLSADPCLISHHPVPVLLMFSASLALGCHARPLFFHTKVFFFCQKFIILYRRINLCCYLSVQEIMILPYENLKRVIHSQFFMWRTAFTAKPTNSIAAERSWQVQSKLTILGTEALWTQYMPEASSWHWQCCITGLSCLLTENCQCLEMLQAI